MESRDDIERQAHQFQAEIERDQVAGRYQHHHAERREQDEDRVLEAVGLFGPQVFTGHRKRNARADQRRDFHEARETIDDEGAVERHDRAGGLGEDGEQRRDQQAKRSTRDDGNRLFPAIRTDKHEDQRADGEHDLRQCGAEGRNGGLDPRHRSTFNHVGAAHGGAARFQWASAANLAEALSAA